MGKIITKNEIKDNLTIENYKVGDIYYTAYTLWDYINENEILDEGEYSEIGRYLTEEEIVELIYNEIYKK